MGRMWLLSSIVSLLIINVYCSVLNIEELNSIHYSIDIVSNPVIKNQDWSTDIITVTNKHGQQYVCTLPKVQIPENEGKKEEDLLDQLVDISELLKPMEAAPCLIKKKDWWTYEFCYGSFIKQYHLKDNKVVGTILILGKYESEYNWKNNSKSKNKLQKFHTQHYVNGTRCDITGEPRRAEVRFHCEEGVGDYIQQVDEPESCRYVIIIATTRVCHHPYLKPNDNRTPHNINCAPALNHNEFEQYQKLQEVKKAKAEKDRLQVLDYQRNSDGDFQTSGDLENSPGDNDTEDDDDDKWSIRLVTIPITKKAKLTRSLLQRGGIDATDKIVDPDDAVRSGSTSDVSEAESAQISDSESFADSKPYLSESELFEQEFSEAIRSFKSKNEQDETDVGEGQTEEEEEEEEELASGGEGDVDRDIANEFKNFKKRMEKLMEKWMEMQNEDHIIELLKKIKQNLDENVQKLEETANKLNAESLNDYLQDLSEMAERYKKELPKAEDLELELEDKMTVDVDSMPELHSKAEKTVLKAIQRKKQLDRLEKFLESELRKTQSRNAISLDHDDEAFSSPSEEENLDGSDEVAAPESDISESSPSSSSSSSFSDPPKSIPTTPSSPKRIEEDPLDQFDLDERETQGTDREGTEEGEESKIEDETKVLNEKKSKDRKTKLEKSIRERLQKSGLDNLGRKIEVKIFTPNYLDDDEKDSLSLSQEDTEAFHNMIVNILSASAEELQEREKHKLLESNYNFRLEDPEVIIEEEEEVKESSSSSIPEIESSETGVLEIQEETDYRSSDEDDDKGDDGSDKSELSNEGDNSDINELNDIIN